MHLSRTVTDQSRLSFNQAPDSSTLEPLRKVQTGPTSTKAQKATSRNEVNAEVEAGAGELL